MKTEMWIKILCGAMGTAEKFGIEGDLLTDFGIAFGDKLVDIIREEGLQDKICEEILNSDTISVNLGGIY